MMKIFLIFFSVFIWCVFSGLFCSSCHAYMLKKDSCRNGLFCSSCNADLLKKYSCGNDDITIYFTNYEDYRIGCCGYKYAKHFFKSYGYSVDVPITIHFEPSIIIDGCNDGYNRESVYGYSNPNSMTIHIRSLASPLISNQEREYFRIKYDKKDWILSDLRLQACNHRDKNLPKSPLLNQPLMAADAALQLGKSDRQYFLHVMVWLYFLSMVFFDNFSLPWQGPPSCKRDDRQSPWQQLFRQKCFPIGRKADWSLW